MLESAKLKSNACIALVTPSAGIHARTIVCRVAFFASPAAKCLAPSGSMLFPEKGERSSFLFKADGVWDFRGGGNPFHIESHLLHLENLHTPNENQGAEKQWKRSGNWWCGWGTHIYLSGGVGQEGKNFRLADNISYQFWECMPTAEGTGWNSNFPPPFCYQIAARSLC